MSINRHNLFVRYAILRSTLGLAGGDADKSNVHVVDSRSYTNEEIATETVVVDSVGQRLNLRIENVRGGGGQRRISLFCPFWIVNTTDHALRYKQDKSSQYVSGTVVSPEHDGSRPVDGSKRSKPAPRRVRFRKRGKRATTTRPISAPANPVATNQDTVFGGTPGALANSPGRYSVSREELGSLLEKDLPLGKLASIAFMFNFHEDVLILGHQKLVVQLADGTGRSKYTSDWSHGFSLDTIGVPQSVG